MKPYKTKRGGLSSNYGKAELTITVNDGKRYPKTTLEFNHPKKKIHPTQKPVELLEYLVKTYSNKGETVLDFCIGSGTTGLAAKNLNRKFIGIEKDETYFKIAQDRISAI